jgi:N-acetyl-alpha-D-muramate 1-phosphate uridylyltransferase
MTKASTTKALILAAGRGERMRPLTDHTPKPLLDVRGKPLMQWAMQGLVAGGFTDFVINAAWLGEKISTHFGEKFDLKISLQPAYLLPEQLSKSDQKNAETVGNSAVVNIRYSHEGRDFGGALETAGGIVRALPMLCDSGDDDVFWVLAGDVFAPDFVFSQDAVDRFKSSDKLAHIWLVPNPEHNLKGDFGLQADGLVVNDALEKYTFSTIALYRKSLFSLPYCDIAAGNPDGVKAALAPLLRIAIAAQQVTGELYTGTWTDVGTPERLSQINMQINNS